ncbi:2-oxoglutarate dehydrogenase, E2 subunit, dihydrolipoamide succinyltransferase [Alicyclobacillus hesperidum URH17-3-68]|uniref:Dihydrolipoyllysine-residue succinyltransferase component of 2-oxoglutarate dehydrogenase complex n=1 Tax=Alicyclobacillus hesperidum TaxID=89784 RepID=A0A1H2Q638_9BACL|nr:2-oxoglutarate dehydrogenase complex dihydrolipoyllysine-residue succinyltransferase [Alicyclobacillus hesperidum]EJY56278.1 2-oxoglutarate dehydrogenase, E2 subunit, dihydrolipoamide succinyltransferase [Alicyclobacillus hesperidum URH17-3-68]GLV12805.1 dihydrolipoyllysine-residue succinyltransferase component of 2-oxoglutarate dehydrogenase complex [Alicyclobacillus hesperidum]SDW02218.1 2-oxoglutarate dehydrogenase E2 component [Alicyclobacillus hesperidum]
MAEVKVPSLGESIVEATIGQWLKREGDAVESGETIAELETDKVNVEVIAEQAGVLSSILKQAGEMVGIGDVIAVISEGAAAAPGAQPQASAAQPAQAAPSPTAQAPVQTAPVAQPSAQAVPSAAPSTVRATPSVRRAALEQGVDLGQVQTGRIEIADLARAAAVPSAPASAPQPTATPTSAARPDEERVRMSRRRVTIAKRLVEAQHTAAMLTTFNEVDMSAVMDVRKRRKDNFKEKYGVGLGFMSFFTKAVVGALKQFPRLNAEIQGEDMIIKHHYDIGIAVATEGGLVVPVVRNADRLTFADIEREIADLAVKARSNKLGLEDLQGGTFTITNGGTFGSLLSTPILNAPQVGILGMHNIVQRPVAVNGQVEIRPMMYIALSYDHRIVDGSEAVRFLVAVKRMIEDPESLLIEG